MGKNDLNMEFVKITEQSSLHDNLEKKSVRDLLHEMNEEDKKVPEAVAKVIPKIELLVDEIVKRLKRGGRVFYIGAGTSGRLGVLDASEIPPTFGVSPDFFEALIAGGDGALRRAVEHAEDDMERGWDELVEKNINANDIVIGIAASGTTPYVVGVLKLAKQKGVFTASISCNLNSPLATQADMKIEVIVGPEFITGSTRLKSGTAQKLVLNMISTVTMIRLGRVKGNKMVNLQPTNDKLVDRGTLMIMDELRLNYENAKNILLIHGSVKNALDAYRK